MSSSSPTEKPQTALPCIQTWISHHRSTDIQSQVLPPIDGRPISWSSKKQSVIVLSMMEAEYISATNATKELYWIQVLLAKPGYPLTVPTILCNNNQSAIVLARDNQYHSRTKHINSVFILFKRLWRKVSSPVSTALWINSHSFPKTFIISLS